VTARNRIVVSPMCQYVSDEGMPNDWHLVHLGKFAIGGAGIVFGEETAVERRGRKTYHCAGIWSNNHILPFRRITDFLKANGAVPAMQLGHGGRKAGQHGAMEDYRPLTDEDAKQGHPPWRGLSASPTTAGPGFPVAREMDLDDIRDVLAAWGEATRRTVDAGFDIVEIHGAHAYLIHQFLSPLSNFRTDGYGGDLKGRMRLGLEIAEAVRAAWPKDKPLFFRLSVVPAPGGAGGLEESTIFCRELVARGVDVIDCSSGGIGGKTKLGPLPRVPGYHVPYSRHIGRETGATTMVVGLITDPHHAEAILQQGDATLIAMARGLMYDSEWPVRAAKELGVPDYLSLFPPPYAHRFNDRERSIRNYPIGCEAVIPHNDDGSGEPYAWPATPARGKGY
jgi:2,4-dienoyl-CoA reductase-like NADH-dependent reductase (Old Yellow Enzyme family)